MTLDLTRFKWIAVFTLGLLFGSTLNLLFSGDWWNQHEDEVVAKVGSKTISKNDFEYALIRRGGEDPASVDKELLLEELIMRQVKLISAESHGFHKNQDIRWRLDSMLIGELNNRLLNPRVEELVVTPEMIEDYYKSHERDFLEPESIELAMLFQRYPSGISASQKSEMVNQLRSLTDDFEKTPINAGFGKWAVSLSDDQSSRYKKGKVGWLVKGKRSRFPTEVEKAAFELKSPGDFSGVIESGNGLYFLRLVNRLPERKQKFDRVQQKIKFLLYRQERETLEKRFEAMLFDQVDIEIDREMLGKIEVPKSKTKIQQERFF